MKIKLDIEIDVGDHMVNMSEEEIAQILFDDVINYNTVQHFGDSMHWCCKGKIGGDDEDPNPTFKRLYEHHKLWGEICSAATWSFKIK